MGLTRQLLMFSRQQVMQPRLLDLNEVIGDVSKMLRRLMGESITLHCTTETDRATIHADAGMIEQVLVNLAVNARDAMLQGGQLTLTTEAVEIPREYLKTNLESRAGRFVCLTVSDTGCGMDSATQAHLFEPFFTTKDAGKGTGLGLATVHGIVKQHEGWIEVTSQVGRGTAFRIYLPSRAAGLEPPPDRCTPKRSGGGTETILLVEDEPGVRKLVKEILVIYGYRVLEASSGVEALRSWAEHGDQVDLLLTDIVMPGGVSGLDLAEKLRTLKPALKVIFTSGFSSDLLKDGGRQRADASFLEKPYAPQKLAQTVRDCLDSKAEVLTR